MLHYNYPVQYRDIIRNAWHLTNNEKHLIWYGVIPSFFSTLVGLCYLTWQALLFHNSPHFFKNQSDDFDKIAEFIRDFSGAHSNFLIFFIIFAVIVALGFLILPPLCEGGLIGLIAAIQRKKEIQATDGLRIGINNFLIMFEYRTVVASFGFTEFFAILSLSIRDFAFPVWLVGFLIFLFLVTLCFSLLFVYAQQFIILEKRNLTRAFMGSVKLTIGNFGKTFLVWTLVLLISIRVFINIILIFLIPVFIAAVTNFFVSSLLMWLGIVLGVIFGLMVFGLAAYLTGVLHVFTTAAWTLTFLSLDLYRGEKLLE